VEIFGKKYSGFWGKLAIGGVEAVERLILLNG